MATICLYFIKLRSLLELFLQTASPICCDMSRQSVDAILQIVNLDCVDILWGTAWEDLRVLSAFETGFALLLCDESLFDIC